MRAPEVDYRKLRLNNVTSPEYRHVLLLLGWVFYFTFYTISELCIDPARCHVIHCGLDDIIPFCEYFIVFYAGWYVVVFGSLIYFFLYDIKSFINAQKMYIFTQVIAITMYFVYPSIQLLRPEAYPRDNIFTTVVSMIQSADTPTGVCPSCHVAFALITGSTWLKKDIAMFWKILLVVFVIGVILSTSFIKQHSVVDWFVAMAIVFVAEIIIYGKSYWLPRLRNKGV